MATDAPAPILELADVVAGYGAMTILNGTTFRVRRGTITTIIAASERDASTLAPRQRTTQATTTRA